MAAGIFLRYYLDSANYDINKAFFSTEAATFFFNLTTAAAKNKQLYLLNGMSTICGNFTRYDFSEIAYKDPAQVAQLIKAKSNLLDGYIKTVNTFIQTQTKG